MNNGHTTIDIWITRSSAFQIQVGGLGRTEIHVREPKFYFEKLTEKDRDLPFGDILENEGMFKRVGWKSDKPTNLSVGSFIGYDNPVSAYIWEKLRGHFKFAPFDNWYEMEKRGECRIEDFCLKIQLKISLE